MLRACAVVFLTLLSFAVYRSVKARRDEKQDIVETDQEPQKACDHAPPEDEQRARLGLIFGRMYKLLGPEKASKRKLKKKHPHFADSLVAVVTGYLEAGDAYYCNIE